MSELPIGDLALVGLSPDFKEWIGEGSHATWVQAAIVARNMDYLELAEKNVEYYSGFYGKMRRLNDAYKVVREVKNKVVNEARDVRMLNEVTVFVNENSIKNGK